MSRIATLTVTTTLLCVTSAVHAQPRRPLLDRVAVPENKRPEKRAGHSKAQPQLSADDMLAVQHEVAPYRERQIQLAEQVVEETPDTQAMEKADLLFRLAELYASKARYLRFRAMELASRIDRAAGNANHDKPERERDRLLRSPAAHWPRPAPPTGGSGSIRASRAIPCAPKRCSTAPGRTPIWGSTWKPASRTP